MWRLPGLLGLALPRTLGPSLWRVTPKFTSPDGPQTASSTLLVPVPNLDRSGPQGPGRSRGPKSHGWKDAFQWMSACVSPNTLRDAISWGTLAVLALQLARQIHFHASLPAGPRRVEHCSWHSPLGRFLSSPLWHPCSSLRQHILPSPDGPAPRHTGLREPRLGQEEASAQPQNFSHNSLRAARPQDPSSEEGVGLSLAGPSDFGFLHASSRIKSKAKPAQPQHAGEQEQDTSKTLSLEEAVTSIQQLFQLSVSIAFNFLDVAQVLVQNVGTWPHLATEDPAKLLYMKEKINLGAHLSFSATLRKEQAPEAVLYYQLAASQGHSLAQYRYARCLLQDTAPSWDPEQQRAVSMLKQAADSGLREAQAFLGVLFTKEPYLDEQRAVKYLWLAANNGDSQSRYHLGICYERGLGVHRNLGEALRCYQQSAALGNEAAQERLRALFSMEAAAPGPRDLTVTGLKSFSSPSLCSLNTLLAGTSHLPHASSTGNLGLLCRSRHFRASPQAPSRAIPPHPCPLERSIVRLGFG
ncbi:death ligand signal enhancer isoform X1 [Callithrix jacchus]|uniref:DAP3-binding cell death enhancer 1 n=1 Tax=Callithrix jacchus TaxID=9483 RepID=A0A8I3X2Z7_CALJA|nr:death ligand signal enhancer isoform X1 [Callithrix jacchus]XP_054106110.1 death ligand signal enhancer isoform X1 [Callithrix jacchus]XP_054106117.1 death ligand signal enhancer isoform X1 [Callithrix jacchus]